MRVELETEQNCNILTPQLFWLSQPFFPILLGYSTGAWGPSIYWDMVLIPASSLQLIRTSCAPSYIIALSPLKFEPSTVKVAPDLLIFSTGCTCYLHRCISSFDSLAGSEVNMKNYNHSVNETIAPISFV